MGESIDLWVVVYGGNMVAIYASEEWAKYASDSGSDEMSIMSFHGAMAAQILSKMPSLEPGMNKISIPFTLHKGD